MNNIPYTNGYAEVLITKLKLLNEILFVCRTLKNFSTDYTMA